MIKAKSVESFIEEGLQKEYISVLNVNYFRVKGTEYAICRFTYLVENRIEFVGGPDDSHGGIHYVYWIESEDFFESIEDKEVKKFFIFNHDVWS